MSQTVQKYIMLKKTCWKHVLAPVELSSAVSIATVRMMAGVCIVQTRNVDLDQVDVNCFVKWQKEVSNISLSLSLSLSLSVFIPAFLSPASFLPLSLLHPPLPT